MPLALVLTSCSSTQSTSSPSATPSPSHTAQPGWKTYVSARWGYSIDYPGDWFDLANFGAPDTQKYFSNENVGAPLEMSARGVWETIQVRPNSTGSCPPSVVSNHVIRQSSIAVDGLATTRYEVNLTPSGAEYSYSIDVWMMHGGSCYSIQFASFSPSRRDASAAVADQAIASFMFGS